MSDGSYPRPPRRASWFDDSFVVSQLVDDLSYHADLTGLAVPMSRVTQAEMQGCARGAHGADEVVDSRRGCLFVRDGTVIIAFGDCPGITPAASSPAGSGTCVLPR